MTFLSIWPMFLVRLSLLAILYNCLDVSWTIRDFISRNDFNVTDITEQSNGKASILCETTRLLKELFGQIDSLTKENASLLSESSYVSLLVPFHHSFTTKHPFTTDIANYCFPGNYWEKRTAGGKLRTRISDSETANRNRNQNLSI